MNSTPQLPGYELDQRLLEHPLAEIWRGRSFTGMEVVALVLSESGAADEEVRGRLGRASRTAALEPGEQQTPLWAANLTAARPYAVTQLVRGQSGAERLLDPLDGLVGNDEESLGSVRSQLAQYGALPIRELPGQAPLGAQQAEGSRGAGSVAGAHGGVGVGGGEDAAGAQSGGGALGAGGAGDAARTRRASDVAGAQGGAGAVDAVGVWRTAGGEQGALGAQGAGSAQSAGSSAGAGGARSDAGAGGATALQGVGVEGGAGVRGAGGGLSVGDSAEGVGGSWLDGVWGKVGAVVVVLVVFCVLYSVGAAIGSKAKEQRPAGPAPGALVTPAALPSPALQPGIVKPKPGSYIPPVPAASLVGAAYERGADVQEVAGIGLPFVFGWPRPPKTAAVGLSPTTVYQRVVTEQNNGAVTLAAQIALRPCATLATCLADRADFDEEWTATFKAPVPATAKDGRTWLTVQPGKQYRLSMTHAFTADGQSWLVGVVVAAVPGEELAAQRVLNDIWRQTQ
ncbi:hypothetical protein [Kribbella sp. CA-294648]|uniref:hypothetical protein n=1 Tax=Kribbella sp. CA-294648 TaxID=3239948 RepID=UPI003D8B5864